MTKRQGGFLCALVVAALVSSCATVQNGWEAAASADTIEAYEDLEKFSLERTLPGLRGSIYGVSPDQPPDQSPVDEDPGERGESIDVKSGSGGRSSHIPDAVTPSSPWGKIVYPQRRVNIRSARSTASRLKGQLEAGHPAKVDFLENDWYAVFHVNQKNRDEKMAMGYVYAPFLMEKRGSGSAGSGEMTAGDDPAKKTGTESPAVEVRNLTFKVAGEGKELLLVEFNRFYAPAISKIEGDKPRIILKIKNAASFRRDWGAIDTEGRLVRKVRSSMNPKTGEAVIVLDMAPEMNYFVNQKFYEKENIYSLEISETE